MDDLISRQAAIDAIFSEPLYKSGMKKRDVDVVIPAIYEKIKSLPPAQPSSSCAHENDSISRQAAIREYQEVCKGIKCSECPFLIKVNTEKGSHLITDCKLEAFLHDLPSAQLGQRYTNEELMIFQHGISLSLLSKRSSQHWQYDEDTATEIEFLERLYEKVGADMRGEQDDSF